MGCSRRTACWRTVVRHVGWASITFVMMLTPLTIRNAIEFDHFIPISTNLGDGMCMSRYIGSNGGFSWADHAWCADPDMPEVRLLYRDKYASPDGEASTNGEPAPMTASARGRSWRWLAIAPTRVITWDNTKLPG